MIWLRLGNRATREIEAALRSGLAAIEASEHDPGAGVLALSQNLPGRGIGTLAKRCMVARTLRGRSLKAVSGNDCSRLDGHLPVRRGCYLSVPRPRFAILGEAANIQEGASLGERIKREVGERFGAVAGSYVRSATHAAGEDLGCLVELARLRGDERVLDVATGGGHTALAFAPYVREVVASDLSGRMLEAAEAHARERGATNVRFVEADAEELPFGDASFDVVTCRIAAHHFPQPRRFVAEVARVLRPGGTFLLDDNVAPEDDDLDAFMNRFERWRDPGHVRARKASEWGAWMEEAGLRVERTEHGRKTYEFDEWTARMRMPEDERDALESWLLSARPEHKRYFEIVEEGGRVISLQSVFAILAARR